MPSPSIIKVLVPCGLWLISSAIQTMWAIMFFCFHPKIYSFWLLGTVDKLEPSHDSSTNLIEKTALIDLKLLSNLSFCFFFLNFMHFFFFHNFFKESIKRRTKTSRKKEASTLYLAYFVFRPMSPFLQNKFWITN